MMRRSCMVASDPWTLLITMEEDPDSLGCAVRIQQLTLDGETADRWELQFARVEEALRELEMAYGIGPHDWTELG